MRTNTKKTLTLTQFPYAMNSNFAGQSWLTSWGYRNDPPLDNDELIRWGNTAAAAIRSLHGTKYDVGSAGSTLYLAGTYFLPEYHIMIKRLYKNAYAR